MMTPILPGGAEAVAVNCSAHLSHHPVPLTLELHHVIPQAWQQAWAPAGVVVDHNGLWDPRTTPLCPTGHRNVHYWIVRLMRTGLGTSAAMEKAVRSQLTAVRGKLPEYAIAKLAVERYEAVGGDLQALQKAGQWGQA